MKKLAETLKILIFLERQAFNIQDTAEKPPEQPATSDQVSAGFADIKAAFAKRLGNAQPA
jgi:hypothetical protein